jgi:hypothetical protein
MDRALAYIEQRLRETLADLDVEQGLTYEIKRSERELVLKLLVSQGVTKQRLWELWRGDWPGWREISFYVPAMVGTEIEWDGTSFLRRIDMEFPWPISDWPISK